MASRMHQKINGLIARKMRREGYEIISFDGEEKLISNIMLNAPPYIKRHRPDIIGVNFKNNKLCIGEAKTISDLCSVRTEEQFLDFANLIISNSQAIKLIIGIPESAKNQLEKLLNKLNLLNNPNVSYIWIPDELIENGNKENL